MIICDIDGTLTKNEENVDHCLGETLTKDEILQIMDPVRIAKLQPHYEVIDKLHDYKKRGEIIILITGRWGYLEAVTNAWLHEFNVPYAALAMRRPEDWQKKSVEVKLAAFEDLKTLKNEVVIVHRNRAIMSAITWIDDDQTILDIVAGMGCQTIKVG